MKLDDSVLVLNVANYSAEDADALNALDTTGVGSAIAAGAAKSAVIIYGNSAISGESRLAIATVADAGGISGAVDLAVIKGVSSAAANFNTADFILA